jgi:hypothetical protein
VDYEARSRFDVNMSVSLEALQYRVLELIDLKSLYKEVLIGANR